MNLFTRKNATLAKRLPVLQANQLVYHGGADYINARLTRFPAESDVDFNGDPASGSVGRKERAFLANYARRVPMKVGQYVFAKQPTRDGIDAKFALDVTATGQSIDQFFAELIHTLITCRWCWLGVDRPGAVPGRSEADREASGDRLYWKLYAPNEVPDWSIDATGRVRWAITEEHLVDDENPMVEAKSKAVRYLHRPGIVNRVELNDKGKETIGEDVLTGLKIPMLFPVGLISPLPWWFDDVERIQRSVLDKQSALDTAIFKTVFPLLVVPASMGEDAAVGGVTTSEARRKIGIGNPIMESGEEKGCTRYVTGSATDIAFIRAEIDAAVRQLFDTVGLNMATPESRQVSSAEAKAWDHLDVGAVLTNYAATCEEAESRLIELSTLIGGGTFKPWAPRYARKFDITNFEADMKSILAASGLNLPPAGERMVMSAAIKAIGSRFDQSDEVVQAALVEAGRFDPASGAVQE
jgi:hypothetical protein